MFKIFLLKKRYIFVTSFFLLCIGCVSNNKEIYIGNKDSGRIENFEQDCKNIISQLNTLLEQNNCENFQEHLHYCTYCNQ